MRKRLLMTMMAAGACCATVETHAADWATVLVPFSDDNQVPTVERLESTDSETVLLRVTFEDGRTDWIAMAPTERELKAGPRSGKGMALCVRIDKDGKQTAFELFGIEPLR